jgi:RNA polymerase sigma-70 factor (family 1)
MRNYSTLAEDELLDRLGSADENAFTEIYNRYWEKLLAVGYYYTHEKQAAEDIVQEVMMSLWSRKKDLRIQSLSAYLGTAVKFSVFKSIVRDRKRRELLTMQNFPESISDIEDKLDAKFLEGYLQGATQELPEKARLVFNFSRNEELSISAIAHRMDLSPKAVEYHMTKALRALKEKLQKIKSFFI